MDSLTVLAARIRGGDLTGAERTALADLVDAVAAAQRTVALSSCTPAQTAQAWSQVGGQLSLLLLAAGRAVS